MKRALGVACLVAMSLLACEGRPKTKDGASASTARKTSGPLVAVIDLSGGAPESTQAGLFGVEQRKRSFAELLDAIDEASKDEDTRAFVVKFGGASIGIARAEELGGALSKLREKKTVTCHADGFTNATYMAAARGCSKIFLSPSGEVEAIGIAAQVVYLRKLLVDELGLDIDILQVGKFKGAEEPLTRDGPSAEARASLEAVLHDLRRGWLDGIALGRPGKSVEGAEDGPYGARAAKDRGMVDDIAYADEVVQRARKESGAVRDVVYFGRGAEDHGDDFGEVAKLLAGGGGGRGPIALVRATGSITMAGGGGVLGGSDGITERDLGRTIAKLEKDDDVKAVVLRIDSPGGSALASDLIWHRLMRLREKKPLVVSVGDMAASGGYYLASTGNTIFAEPTSIVGSIGVVGGKVGLGGTLERFGVHAETFAASSAPGAANRAAYSSTFTPWDDATRARVLESMTDVYDLFLARVAEGRHIPVAKVAESAEGRIFGGNEGKSRQLVDEIGGLRDAIAKARSLAKLPDTAEVTLVEKPAQWLDAIDPQSDNEERAESLTSRAGARPMDLVREIAPEVEPFAASLAPLAAGERCVTAMPYALSVR